MDDEVEQLLRCWKVAHHQVETLRCDMIEATVEADERLLELATAVGRGGLPRVIGRAPTTTYDLLRRARRNHASYVAFGGVRVGRRR